MRSYSMPLGLIATFTLGAVATASAGSISTSLVLRRQDALVCTVANVSTKPVQVGAVTMLDENGASLTLLSDKSNCTFPGAVSPGLSCIQVFDDTSTAGLFARCVVQAHGSQNALRVRILTQGSVGDVEASDGR
jgi:hypothetical protein